MSISNMKNMIVLKNLPSNMIEEAFVVLKSNVKNKNLEKIENYKVTNSNSNQKNKNEYILKEAEMFVADYISKIENNKKPIKKENIKRIKIWAFIASAIAVLEFFLLI